MKPLEQPIRAHLVIEPGRTGDFPSQLAGVALCRVPSALCEDPEPEVLDYYGGYADALRKAAWEAESRGLPVVLDPASLLAIADLLDGPKPDVKPTLVVHFDGGAIHGVEGNILADVIFLDPDHEGADDDEVVLHYTDDKGQVVMLEEETVVYKHTATMNLELVDQARRIANQCAIQHERVQLEKAGAIDDEVTG